MKDTIYPFHFKDSKGKIHHMSEFKGRVILIVNTATKCGLAPQLEGLEKLYTKYKNKGFIVLGFPSNDFANQEPENNSSMAVTCKLNFGVTFPLSEKVHVNGEKPHPIFNYLKKNTTSLFGQKIKWNFTKFLISNIGVPIKRFSPTTKPEKIEKHIANALKT